MQQSKMALGEVLAAGILASATAAPEEACFINLLSAGSAMSPDTEYICQNFEEAIKDGTLLSPCGTNEQAYNMYSLICGTATPTPIEEAPTPVSMWTYTTTPGPSASEDITPFEVLVTSEAAPSETYSLPTAFEKITGCTSHDIVVETTSPDNDIATSATPATPATPSETEDEPAGGLSMQDIRTVPVLMACLGLCALLW